MTTFKLTHRLQLKQLERRDPQAAKIIRRRLFLGQIDEALTALAAGLARFLQLAQPVDIFITGDNPVALNRPAPQNIGQEIKQLLGQPLADEPEPARVRKPTEEEIERGYRWALGNHQRGFSTPWTDSARWNRIPRR